MLASLFGLYYSVSHCVAGTAARAINLLEQGGFGCQKTEHDLFSRIFRVSVNSLSDLYMPSEVSSFCESVWKSFFGALIIPCFRFVLCLAEVLLFACFQFASSFALRIPNRS